MSNKTLKTLAFSINSVALTLGQTLGRYEKDVGSKSASSSRVGTKKCKLFPFSQAGGVPNGARNQSLFGYRVAIKETSFECRQRQVIILLSESSSVLLQHTGPLYSPVKRRNVKQTIDSHLVLRLRMYGAITLCPHTP